MAPKRRKPFGSKKAKAKSPVGCGKKRTKLEDDKKAAPAAAAGAETAASATVATEVKKEEEQKPAVVNEKDDVLPSAAAIDVVPKIEFATYKELFVKQLNEAIDRAANKEETEIKLFIATRGDSVSDGKQILGEFKPSAFGGYLTYVWDKEDREEAITEIVEAALKLNSLLGEYTVQKKDNDELIVSWAKEATIASSKK